MSASETMSKCRRRSFSSDFKAEVVELCRQPGRRPHSMAAELDLTETTVLGWVNQADVNAGIRPGTTFTGAEEMVRLRKQLWEVTEGRDILARARGVFAYVTIHLGCGCSVICRSPGAPDRPVWLK